MVPDVFDGTNAVDQYTFDQTPQAKDKLQQHWSTYFTEADIKTLKSYGVNALRIPCGFWTWDNADTPYIQGAEQYLDKALEWARDADMLVWIDLHGHPGSQNGFDNSGREGDVDWQQGNNMDRSISVLTTIATKYGAEKYADVVAGIELVNEPINYGNNDVSKTISWAVQAYNAVRGAAANKDLQIITHDSFEPASSWFGDSKQLNAQSNFYGFALDTHLYQVFVATDSYLDQDGHISKACDWQTTALLPSQQAGLPIYAGEWTATTNACINPDGSSINGTSTQNDCKVPGCQCIVDTPTSQWSNSTKSAVRKFVEAQLSAFEAAGSGYFVWSAKGQGTWSFMQGVEEGWFPKLDGDFQHACDGVH
ncbi:glycoside hydrolase [Rhizodiscina lignyota]|uniref:glucan 1,3-beta-glucosidase n=1 Tax=Rhizodiscina lignyota TaxID=1504668 RepID=A0A9P4IEE4_9PEZI|nr:glycoside hydrolase [Rhizodiscina lignyota]